MLTLNNLEKAGLLKPQTSSRNNYPTIRKTLKLWMEDANEQVQDLQKDLRGLNPCSFAVLSSLTVCFLILQNPNDISYVYSGYAPLSIRLTQVLARPGWRSIEEVLKMLPGPHFEERQQLPAGLHKKRKDQYKLGLLFALLLTKQSKSKRPACLLRVDKAQALSLLSQMLNSSRLMAQSWQCHRSTVSVCGFSLSLCWRDS